MTNVVILGTGMAGFGAAHRLHTEGIMPVMYDRNGHYGGLTASFTQDGFVFDLGPHISFTKDPRIQALLAESVEQQYEAVTICLNNYWHGHWPLHPVQLHLQGLPAEVIVQVIEDFVAERSGPERAVNNYADWLLASFGRSFAKLFPMQYTRKYHLTSAENLTTDWVGPRLYRPELGEILRGALSASAPQMHYITDFRYPTHGGFVAYLRKFVPLGNLRLNHEVVAIDPVQRQIIFADQPPAQYDALISSLPLPELVRMIRGAPPDVVEAATKLACSSCVLVNLGVNRQDLSSAHVTYFYDEDICFSRLSFPHMLSHNNCPPGTGAIQAEVYFADKYKPLAGAPQDWIEPVIADLRRCGILRDDDAILLQQARLVRYANVIFDLDRLAALRRVHGYLDEVGIAYCGRHGDWGYMWTDESFKSGERAAEKMMSGGG